MSYCVLMWSQVFAVKSDIEFDIQTWLNMKTEGIDLVDLKEEALKTSQLINEN